MTDRTNILTVTLDREMRVDDVEIVVNAIKMLRYVQSVRVNVTTHEEYLAHERLGHQYRMGLYHLANALGESPKETLDLLEKLGKGKQR